MAGSKFGFAQILQSARPRREVCADAGSQVLTDALTRPFCDIVGLDAMKHVLVVDDNQDLAENIAEILSLSGFVARVATSAEEALPMALPEGPELLVTDFRLPDMNGAELVQRVRQQRQTVRAIVISAYTDELTVAAAKNAGAAFLAKPVDVSALSRILTAA